MNHEFVMAAYYRKLIRLASPASYGAAFLSMLFLAVYYIYPVAYTYGIFGWVILTMFLGLRLEIRSYKLLINNPGWKVWKELTRGPRWLHHFYTGLFAVLMAASMVNLANAFLGFVPWIPADTSIMNLASYALSGSFSMGTLAVLYALFYGRFRTFLRASQTPAVD